MSPQRQQLLLSLSLVGAAAALGLWLVLTPTVSDGQPTTMGSCKYTKINAQGAANADIAISTSAVPILLGNGYRCTGLIYNNGLGDMRCAPDTAGVPTATTGLLIKAGASLKIGRASCRERGE